MLLLETYLVNCSINFHWNDKISVVDRLWTQQRKQSVFSKISFKKTHIFSNTSILQAQLLMFLPSM